MAWRDAQSSTKNLNIPLEHAVNMGLEEDGSVCSVGSGRMGSTALFSGPDIAAQVQELEKRVAQQVGDDGVKVQRAALLGILQVCCVREEIFAVYCCVKATNRTNSDFESVVGLSMTNRRETYAVCACVSREV